MTQQRDFMNDEDTSHEDIISVMQNGLNPTANNTDRSNRTLAMAEYHRRKKLRESEPQPAPRKNQVTELGAEEEEEEEEELD